ncbi:hypothetical protein ACP4OV_013520 [Aristida adscensionis]
MHDHHHCHDPAPPMSDHHHHHHHGHHHHHHGHHHHGRHHHHHPPAHHHSHDPSPPPPAALGPPDFWNNPARFPGPPSWGSSSSGAPCTVRVEAPPAAACDAAAPLLEPRPHGDCDGAAAPSRTDLILGFIIWAFFVAWIIYCFGFH